MSLPRLLTIMGSGETAPTMVKVHRGLLDRLGERPVPAVMLDTPFGFQENADDITERAVAYFADSVGAPLGVASLRSAADDTLTQEKALAAIRTARYVFAGPGSPTYALAQWAETQLPGLLADKLERGGCVTFSSAAALTLGLLTVPVYEIYKVGSRPHWLEGLNLVAAAGLRAVIIPHYNNAEGGNHDTRYCYLGERRLSLLEGEMPDDAFVLGIDEHTGVILDLDAGTADVVGLGQLTIRKHGRSTTVPSGETVAISDLARMAEGATAAAAPAPAASDQADEPAPTPGESPLMAAVHAREADFEKAVAERDADAASAAVLGLDDDLVHWAADTAQSDEPDRARAVLRSLVVRLGQLAGTGLTDPRQAVAPLVDMAIDLRTRARAEKRWTEADAARDALEAAGVEVMDTPDGTVWRLRD